MTIYDAINKKFHFRGRKDNLPWNSPRGRRELLGELFYELDFKKGAEIGTRIGTYAKILCDANPNLKLYCIDPWMAYGRLSQDKQDEFYKQAMLNLAKYNNIQILRMTSMEALKEFNDRELDFGYIDGNHEFDYCCPDIIFWSKKVKSGGIVACHDYYPFYRAGVVKAVDAYTHCHCIDPWYITREVTPTAFWVNP
jgi:predicted O-methyltransferase YrrM